MKTYQKLEDVAEALAGFHRTMKELFRSLAEGTDEGKAKILLDYLQETEKRFERGLASFHLEGEENIEKAWVQYLPRIKHVIPEDVDLSRNVTLDEAGEIALDFHSRLVDFYNRVAGLAGAPPGVREVFAELAKQQEHEKKKLAKTMHQIRKMP